MTERMCIYILLGRAPKKRSAPSNNERSCIQNFDRPMTNRFVGLNFCSRAIIHPAIRHMPRRKSCGPGLCNCWCPSMEPVRFAYSKVHFSAACNLQICILSRKDERKCRMRWLFCSSLVNVFFFSSTFYIILFSLLCSTLPLDYQCGLSWVAQATRLRVSCAPVVSQGILLAFISG